MDLYFPIVGETEKKGTLSYSKMTQEVSVSTKDTQEAGGNKVNKGWGEKQDPNWKLGMTDAKNKD